MWIKAVGLLALITLVFASCKKQDINAAFADEDYPTDPAVGVYKLDLVSADENERILDVTFCKMNGINSEIDFTAISIDPFGFFGADISIDSSTVIPPASIPSYTNVLMVQTNGTAWMEFTQMTLGLSKYCNELEGDALKKLAVVTFMTGGPDELAFTPTTLSMFEATADENKNQLYTNFAENEFNTGALSSDAVFAAQMNHVIDSLIMSPFVVGQKMITLIDERENGGLQYTDSTLMDGIVERAIANDIIINLISFDQAGQTYGKFPHKTGGFYFYNSTENQFLTEFTRPMHPLGTLCLNLERLASKNLFQHFFRLKISLPNGSAEFAPDEIVNIQITYNQERIFFQSYHE